MFVCFDFRRKLFNVRTYSKSFENAVVHSDCNLPFNQEELKQRAGYDDNRRYLILKSVSRNLYEQSGHNEFIITYLNVINELSITNKLVATKNKPNPDLNCFIFYNLI